MHKERGLEESSQPVTGSPIAYTCSETFSPKTSSVSGLTAAAERLFQILALASRKLLLISNLSVPMAQLVIIHSCASIVLRLEFNVKTLC